jgi:hypothetical protein
MKKADNYILYLSGLITENQLIESIEKNNENNLDPPEIKRLLQRLSIKIGEKANRYTPLIKHVAKDKIAVNLFAELIENLSLAATAKIKSVLDNKDINSKEEVLPSDLSRLLRRLQTRLGEAGGNKYLPLIKHVAKKKDLLASFEELIKNLGLINPGTVKGIIK